MSVRMIAAACAALVLMAVPQAGAADFRGDNAYPPYEGEPGYAEDYRDEGLRDEGGRGEESYGGREDRFARPQDDRIYERQGSVKDGYPVPQPPGFDRRYTEHSEGRYDRRFDGRFEGRYDGPEAGCVPTFQIKHRLRAQGWTDLRPIETGGRLATLRARRQGSGENFVLKVDNCSGEIVHARPQFLRTFGAYDRRPWRYGSRRY